MIFKQIFLSFFVSTDIVTKIMSTATNIASIGLYQVNDEGAMTFNIDDVRGANNDFTPSTTAYSAPSVAVNRQVIFIQ